MHRNMHILIQLLHQLYYLYPIRSDHISHFIFSYSDFLFPHKTKSAVTGWLPEQTHKHFPPQPQLSSTLLQKLIGDWMKSNCIFKHVQASSGRKALLKRKRVENAALSPAYATVVQVQSSCCKN